MNFAHLLDSYGLIVVFAVTALKVSTVVLLAGLAAHSGYMDVWWVSAVAIIGTVFFSTLYFLLARFAFRRFIRSHPKLSQRVNAFNRRFESTRSILSAVFFFRFIPGFRVATPFIVASLKESFIAFTIANVLGAILWAVIFVLIGFFFGALADHFLQEFKHYEWYVVIAIVIAGLLLWLLYYLYKRHGKKRIY